MHAPIRLPVARSLSAAFVAVCLIGLTGCGSTPDVEDVPHRDPASGVGGAGSEGMVGEADDAGAAMAADVPLLRRTEDVNGSPVLYSMVLIDDAAELPGPVAEALQPDFESESVIFLGMGRQEGEGFGTRITKVERAGDRLTVSATFTRPSDAPAGGPTTPWSAVVIPKQQGVSMPLLSDFD